MGARKGQFFVLAAVLLISLFFMGLPDKNNLITSKTGDMVFLFDNVYREYPFALNNALNMSDNIEDSIDRLSNFTRYTDTLMSQRLINYSTLWVITRNSSATSWNATVGNFLGYDMVVNVSLCSPSCSKAVIVVPNNSTNSTTWGIPLQTQVQLFVEFDSESHNVSVAINKINLYSMVRMQRGENIVQDYAFY